MIIRDKNIELRAIEPDDYKNLTEILSAPQVESCLFGYPSKLKEMAFHEWLSSAFQNKNAYYYVVKEPQNSDTVGICAYQDIDYRNGSVTLWVAIAPEHTNKDYGVQALRILARNAFDQLRMEHVALYCLENDIAAKSWAKSVRFSLDVVLNSRIKMGDHRLNLELYSLLKEEDKLQNAEVKRI